MPEGRLATSDVRGARSNDVRLGESRRPPSIDGLLGFSNGGLGVSSTEGRLTLGVVGDTLVEERGRCEADEETNPRVDVGVTTRREGDRGLIPGRGVTGASSPSGKCPEL